MISIEQGEKVVLPKKFHVVHNLCAIVYDLIGEIIKDSPYQELLTTTIELRDGEKEAIDQLDNRDVLDWLNSTSRNNEISVVLKKHLLCSIISDLCNFLHESLNCAKKGKMSVAYTLLRKPLTDELLLLEQLLVDGDELISRFFHLGDPRFYDPSQSKVGRDKLKEIIRNSVELLDGITTFDSDLIYQLRYDKTCEGGLNGIMNMAHHIVTTDPNYSTSRRNLNFVFSVKEDYDRHWHQYYSLVPYLIIYCSSIIDKIAFNLMSTNEELRAIKELRRYVAFVFWSIKTYPAQSTSASRLFKVLGKEIGLCCKKCKHQNNFEKADFKLFLEIEELLCSNCFSPLLTTGMGVQKIRDIAINRKKNSR